MSTEHSTSCRTRTSTAGKGLFEASTKPSGVLSSRQITAHILAGTWWPFDKVDAALLQKLHRQKEKTKTSEPISEALI